MACRRTTVCYTAYSQAVHRYVPQAYPDRITLFTTAASPTARPDRTLGWHQLTEVGVDVHQIPGNHFTMLRKPQVELLAQRLKACIEKPFTDDSSPTI